MKYWFWSSYWHDRGDNHSLQDQSTSLINQLLNWYMCCLIDEVGCVVPEICNTICENPRSCSDIAYPKIVMELLPTGKVDVCFPIMSSASDTSIYPLVNAFNGLVMSKWLAATPSHSYLFVIYLNLNNVNCPCLVGTNRTIWRKSKRNL